MIVGRRLIRIVGLLAALALVFWIRKELQPQSPGKKLRTLDELTEANFGEVPFFELIDSSGESFESIKLLGKPWVASYFFTRCQGPCPLIQGRVAELSRKLGQLVNFVSFSADPERDTPKDLEAYALKLKANIEQWSFLTGSPETLKELATKHFRLAMGDAPDFHSTRLVLIDKVGKIRGYFDGQETASWEKLEKAILLLAAEDAPVASKRNTLPRL